MDLPSDAILDTPKPSKDYILPALPPRAPEALGNAGELCTAAAPELSPSARRLSIAKFLYYCSYSLAAWFFCRKVIMPADTSFDLVTPVGIAF